MKRVFTFLTLSTLLFVAIASVASAGGWAVVTLDAMPPQVVVNQPVTIGMMIRQHGRTPWVYENVRVRGFHSTGETYELRAVMDQRGHYTATLNFPRAGTWQWAVSSGLMPEWQPMPNLIVEDPAQRESEFAAAHNATAPFNASNLRAMVPSLAMLGLGILGFVGSSAGLWFWWRKHR